MRSKLGLVIGLLVLANVIALVVYTQMRHKPLNAHESQIQHDAQYLATPRPGMPNGMMRKEDFSRLEEMRANVRAPHPFSDQDFDFLMGMLQQRPPYDHNYYQLTDILVMGVLLDKGEYTEAQRKQILVAVMPLLSKEDQHDNYGALKFRAASALALTQDKQAVPYLLPLLKDQRSKIRIAAAESLRTLGYSVPGVVAN